MSDRPRVAEVITWLDTGGATRTVEALVAGLAERFDLCVIAGAIDGASNDQLARFRELGVDVHEVPSLRRSIGPRDVSAYRDLQALLRALDPAVVHTHSGKAGLIGRLVADRLDVPAIVHTVHGWSRGGSHMLDAVERFAARRCDRLVTVTGVDRKYGLEHRIGLPEQYVVIRSGIELDHFTMDDRARVEARRSWECDDATTVIGSVGRLSAQKDPLTLIDAFVEFERDNPDSRLVLVGDGPLRSLVTRRVAASGLRGSVVLTGALDDVSSVLPGFDVFTLASRWEGLPRAVIEAMAVGLPVVTTPVAGLAEVVLHGETGLRVEPGDAAGLARAWSRITREEGLADRLVSRATRTLPEFAVETMVAQTAALYGEVLQQPRVRGRERLQ